MDPEVAALTATVEENRVPPVNKTGETHFSVGFMMWVPPNKQYGYECRASKQLAYGLFQAVSRVH
jgi:hypothetical protein